MEAVIKEFAHYVSLGCTVAALLVLTAAAATAAVRVAVHWRRYDDMELKKEIWLRFAGSIVLALEFALAADIADTAVAPTWDDIGRLAAIATIRTLLNLFLERDIDALRELKVRKETSAPAEEVRS